MVTRLINGRHVPKTLADAIIGEKGVRATGERIVYANGGFNLLGYIVQHAHKRPFEELVRERVLEPLGMSASFFGADPGEKPGIATPYGKGFGGSAGRKPAGNSKVWATPAGGLMTSADELARFGEWSSTAATWTAPA
ncbi:MAG: serine hydrolase domain-containing protein [Dehalococcoidia bacterium]